jgi:cellulose synthase/poly-beta-1,6-N-acetylglucosamine synthase-like glycosyltransferase
MSSQSQQSGRVVVALPTTASARYLSTSLARLVPELRELAASRDVTLALCVNGPDPDGLNHEAARSAVAEVHEQLPQVDTVVLVREAAGKSGAVTELLAHARSIGASFFLIVDDDVAFSPGTLSRNIDALANAPADEPVLVGARILAPERSLRSFLRGQPAHRALSAWWWQSVFRLPYEPASEFFLFSPGPCSAMRVEHYPELPPDDTSIFDDVYVNYWSVSHGGTILQPPGSIVYFHVASGYREWIRQQLRIVAGVEATLAMFPDRADEIRRVFAWAYSHNKEARIRARCHTPRRLLLLVFYRLAQEDLLRRYHKLETVPDWGRAESTKDGEFSSATE